jgi:hypothetical protein
MASITISSPVGAQTNQTTTFIPYNNNGIFNDSMLQMIDSNIMSATNIAGNDEETNGLYIDNGNGLYQFGDFYGKFHNSCIIMDSDYGNITFYNHSDFNINFENTGRIYIDGNECIKTTAGTPILNKFLYLSINGNDYKIALLNP